MGQSGSRSKEVIEYRITLVLLYLMLGAGANIAVAWWAAASLAPPWQRLVRTVEDPAAATPEQSDWPWLDGRPANAIPYDPLEHRTGWPLTSMACEFPCRHQITSNSIPLDGLTLPPQQFGERLVPRALPTRPLWASFAGNTIFYAALMGSPVMLVMARRPLRRRPARRQPAPGQSGIRSAAPVPARPALPWYCS